MPDRDPSVAEGGGNRILWNAGREVVDEIVVRDCMVHLEETDRGVWYVAIYPASHPDERVMFWVRGKITVTEEIPWDEDKEHARASGPSGPITSIMCE